MEESRASTYDTTKASNAVGKLTGRLSITMTQNVIQPEGHETCVLAEKTWFGFVL